MYGYYMVSIIAEDVAKRFAGIRLQEAYGAYRRRADEDDYRGLSEYRKYGYVPCDLIEQSASRSCNYACDDYCVAVLAERAGNDDELKRLHARSLSYRNVYDKESGFVRPRLKDAAWASPFDPKAIKITKRWRDSQRRVADNVAHGNGGHARYRYREYSSAR